MKKSTSIVALVMSLLISAPSMADQFGERESLAKLMHELDALHEIINEAEGRHDTTSRIEFNYKALRSDLAKLRFGVKEYLDGQTIEPRKYAPLSGDYVQ